MLGRELIRQPRQHLEVVIARDRQRRDVVLGKLADALLQRPDRLPEAVALVRDVSREAHQRHLLRDRRLHNAVPRGRGRNRRRLSIAGSACRRPTQMQITRAKHLHRHDSASLLARTISRLTRGRTPVWLRIACLQTHASV